MAGRAKSHPILSELPPYDDEGNLRIVIETPKGSRNKYSFDPECNALLLKSVLPEGMSFPYDFGFIPSTLADDGDPVDVLVLMDAPVIPACVIRARIIGAIEAEQKKKGGDWQENDRLVAVATHAEAHQHEKSLKDLRPHLVDEIIAFFVEYNQLRGGQFRNTGLCGSAKACKLVEAGRDANPAEVSAEEQEGRFSPCPCIDARDPEFHHGCVNTYGACRCGKPWEFRSRLVGVIF
jgi:inorganic pyrophosphatase